MASDMKLYGMYSAESAKMWHSSAFYRRPDGSVVEVTAVYPEPNCPSCKWPDAVWVGEVTEFVRIGLDRELYLQQLNEDGDV